MTKNTKHTPAMVDHVRRDLMKRFLGLGAGLAISSTWSTNSFAAASDWQTVADTKPVKVTDHVYALYARGPWPTLENQGFFANIYLVKTAKGIVVLDTGTSVQIGEMALRAIKKAFNQPVIAAFNSHYHGDHWLGNHAFVNAYPELPIYAHPDAIGAIENAVGADWLNQMIKATNGAIEGTKVTAPNKGVSHGQTFNYGDVTLKVHSYGPAHSPVDIMIEVVEDKALFVGDIIMDHRIGNPSETSFQGYIKTLNIIRSEMSDRLLMPGHGKPGHDKLLRNYEDIMNGIYENAVKAVEDGLSIAETKELVLKDPRIERQAKVTEGFEDIGKFVNFAYTEAEQAAF
ncbi:MBL fold metallo-hydrolase [Thiomicrorhabdus sp.]|uniref:MBL fold metallo-hydrolase n=1 Tax=Thiomicrorhabdus sp. TaxID=2039724 RepID=UPI0029C79D8C|nr:MBL fold metallo-hydrolase [Thiomicrorhabdus sp.]